MCVKNARVGGGKQTYESMFYRRLEKGKYIGNIKGFPNTIAAWCKHLKFDNKGVDVRRYVLSSQQSEESNTRLSNICEQRELVHKIETNLFTNRSSRERERRHRRLCNTSELRQTSLYA